jgi:PAS domain S-box-containing protein
VAWSVLDLIQFIASGDDVALFDSAGTEIDPPANLADVCGGRTTRPWDGRLTSVHAPDRSRLLALENATRVEPGRVHMVEFRACADGVWRRLRARVVRLVGHPDVGVVRLLDVVEPLPCFDCGADGQAADEPLWVRMRVRAGGGILALEGTVEELYGRRPEELLGHSAIDFVHPDDLHAVTENSAACYAEPGRAATTSLRLLRPDGGVVPLAVTSTVTPALDEFQVYLRHAGQSLRQELTTAVASDQLVLNYHPVFEMGTGHMIGAEALLRWRHPERGIVPPGDFIPLAETSEAIVEIGAWVLQQACRDAATWPDHLRIAVNLSVRQLADRAIVDTVASALDASGLEPRRLVLEVTETALMENAARALAHLRALKALGVRVAIDDFGTGYSSLQYLAQMPVDILKIDRSFVAGLGVNDRHTTIVTSVIALAHALGMCVVAEGVETDPQHRQLFALGADAAQGFLWSRPVGAEEFRRLLAPELLAIAPPPRATAAPITLPV